MALTKMSLETAEEIISLYTDLCSKEAPSNKYKVFKYSDLKGFDIIDINNAFKISSAYQVFDLGSENIDKIKEFIKSAEMVVGGFSFFFAPDEVAKKIIELDKKNKDATKEYLLLRRLLPKRDIEDLESIESFFNYCISIDRQNENFWELVFNRLRIQFDDINTNDSITFIIQNKHLFFKKIEIKTKVSPLNESEDMNIPTFYHRNKYIIDLLVTYLLLGFSFYIPTVRVIVFSLIAILITMKIYIWIEEPIKQRIHFMLSLVQLLFFIGAIFNSNLTIYALGVTVLYTIIELFNKKTS